MRVGTGSSRDQHDPGGGEKPTRRKRPRLKETGPTKWACAPRHLEPGGRVAIDVINPMARSLDGDPDVRPFFTRRHAERDRIYTRFAAIGPLDADQRQRLYGWYDELDEQGRVTRTHYSMYWRPIFRAELELMLEASGLEVESIEGGHCGEPFASRSPRLFLVARRVLT